MFKPSRAAAALLAAAALVVAACGGSDDNTSSNSSSAAKTSSSKPVTIDWWHIQNNDPLKTIWKNAADEYMAAHPNVKIKITVLENEAFKAKLTTNMQAGNLPDIFQSWGGGTLKEQADAGPGAGHHRSRPSRGSERSTTRASGSTRSTASSTACRTTSAWSGSGTTRSSSRRPASTARRPLERVPRRRPEAEGRRHHADRRRREGQVARHVLVGVPVAARRRRGRDGQGGHRRRTFTRPASSRPARSSRSSST